MEEESQDGIELEIREDMEADYFPEECPFCGGQHILIKDLNKKFKFKFIIIIFINHSFKKVDFLILTEYNIIILIDLLEKT